MTKRMRSHSQRAGEPQIARPDVEVKIVDADVHPAPHDRTELAEYLPEAWRARRLPSAVLDAVDAPIYATPGSVVRLDSKPSGGGPAGSDPVMLEDQLFRSAGVDMAILLPLTARPMANPEHEAAVCAATNLWMDKTWLGRYNWHDRYRASLRVSSNSAELAAREIDKWAGHPRFVQVMLIPYTSAPLGQSLYDPIYAAASRANLPVAIHVNRGPGARLLGPVGFSSYFIEHHMMYPVLYATHLVSFVFDGTFERFPDLRLVFVEGGFSWLVPLLWRMDRHWEALRVEVPWVRRRPSDYVRDHVLFTSQPFEEPAGAADLATVFEWADAEHTLMFSTDYPHWDFDDPTWVIRRIRVESRPQILSGNASRIYHLPATVKALSKAPLPAA
jgi:predicted TIM-barrel fold metal-dependent hydrolase